MVRRHVATDASHSHFFRAHCASLPNPDASRPRLGKKKRHLFSFWNSPPAPERGGIYPCNWEFQAPSGKFRRDHGRCLGGIQTSRSEHVEPLTHPSRPETDDNGSRASECATGFYLRLEFQPRLLPPKTSMVVTRGCFGSVTGFSCLPFGEVLHWKPSGHVQTFPGGVLNPSRGQFWSSLVFRNCSDVA